MTPRERLRARGLVVGQISGSPDRPHPLTRFEPPVFLSGDLALHTQVEVGAFSGLYGSAVRHALIGRYTSIARGVQIGLDNHPLSWVTTSMMGYVEAVHGWSEFLGTPAETIAAFSGGFDASAGLTVIGNDVWIGDGAFVSAGVTLGDGCVVGARSVVTRDVPPYTVVAGNPARALRERHPLDLISDLLRIEPWRFNLYDLPAGVQRDSAAFVRWYDDEGHDTLRPYGADWIGSEELSGLVPALTGKKR